MVVHSFLRWLARLSWQSPAERQCTLTWDTLGDFQSAPHGSVSLCLRSRSTISVKGDYCSPSRRRLTGCSTISPPSGRTTGSSFWPRLRRSSPRRRSSLARTTNATGYPTRFLATHEHRPHCRPRDRADLHSICELGTGNGNSCCCHRLRIVRCPGWRLWHRGLIADGSHDLNGDFRCTALEAQPGHCLWR